MDSDDHKAVVFKVKSLTAESRATVPKTEKVKLRSALNAVKHGLAGRGLLLPGEDPVEYGARLDEVFASLSPKDEGEAQLVALVGDDLWKLARLARIEKGATLAKVEEMVATSGSGEHATILTNAIQQLGQALVAWSAEPVPTERNQDFDGRVRSMSDAVDVVERANLVPLAIVDKCTDALFALRAQQDGTGISPAAWAVVFQMAREILTPLLDLGTLHDAEQDALRIAVGRIALPDEAELKKLAKYRAMLELSLQRRLAALAQLRALTAGNVSSEKDVERAREFRMRLRIVA
jgi:hypothetical protein